MWIFISKQKDSSPNSEKENCSFTHTLRRTARPQSYYIGILKYNTARNRIIITWYKAYSWKYHPVNNPVPQALQSQLVEDYHIVKRLDGDFVGVLPAKVLVQQKAFFAVRKLRTRCSTWCNHQLPTDLLWFPGSMWSLGKEESFIQNRTSSHW